MPTTIQIVPVTTRRQQKQFINFAWEHYRGDPNWVPPLLMSHRELLNYKHHPFYDNAEIQTFLAFRGGTVVGRIAAIIDHGHNQHHNEKRGMFGFYECIDDQQVANRLFDAARDWHAEREIHLLRGPMNPAMNHECSLLIDGFDMPPTFMMTYNKPYYARLIENYGFQKSQDLFAFWGHVSMLDEMDPKILNVANEAIRRFNITVRRIDKKHFQRDVESFFHVYNRALPGTWGFVPLTEAELKHMASGLKQLVVPEMTAMAEVDGKPVGCAFGLLDYNPIIKKINGRLFPFGFLHLLQGRKSLKKVRLISTNVVMEYQRWGLGLVLLNRIVPDAKNWGIEEGEFSWVLESNHLSRATLERAGAKLQKTYRIYDFEPQ